jgi:putative SOS response-associated peptidase YedK
VDINNHILLLFLLKPANFIAMCFHYSMSQVAQNLENRYNAPFTKGFTFQPVHHVSGFTFPLMPVVTAVPEHEIELCHWGLVPSWTQNEEQAGQMRAMTLNARSETVFEKPSFRKSIQSRRCLIPADGFFEWQTVGNKRIPWYIRSNEQEIFSFGGIWDHWKNEVGKSLNTFSILTTDANPMMAEIHNTKRRMPLIIPVSSEAIWLDPSISGNDILKLMVPYPEEKLESWTISKLITTRGAKTNTPEVKAPFSWPEINLNSTPRL